MSLYLGNNLISGNKPINLGVRNIGEVVASAIPLTDAGLHLFDGSLILGGGIYQGFVDYIANIVSIYPGVFTTESAWQQSVSTYGACGKFVYDDVNNTVRLPKVTCKIDGTTDINALGDLEPLFVRLPNITGVVDAIRSGNSWAHSYSGAFYDTGQRNQCDQANGGSYPSAIGFSASRSSSVYSGNGSDTTIHEQAIKMFFYIVVANSTKTEIQVDIDEVVTDLNGKADIDLTNITSIAPILEMIQNTDSTKVGYVYSVPYTVNTAVYAPTGGKWLILNCYYIASSTAIVYHYSDQNVYTGSIVNGGTLILQARSGYGSVVGLLKIA